MNENFMISNFMLNNRNIIITGASSGIGRQCAVNCSKMGATVILMGRNEERLKETLSMMENISNHLIYKIDIIDYERIGETVKDIVQKIGKINGLVNCAGISTTSPFRMITPSKMDQFLHVNVHGGINLSSIITKQENRSENGVSIVFITSVMGTVGEIGKTLYGITKGALIAASKSMAIELAPKKIRVNCISPGVVETPMSLNSVYCQNEDALKKIVSYHPLGLGDVNDIANACIFLLSDAAKWITGTNIFVDGGYTAR